MEESSSECSESVLVCARSDDGSGLRARRPRGECSMSGSAAALLAVGRAVSLSGGIATPPPSRRVARETAVEARVSVEGEEPAAAAPEEGKPEKEKADC
jgi:hypothetical protein